MHRWLPLTLLCLFLCAPPAPAQVSLGWKLKPGEKFYQETTATLKQTTKIRGQETHQELEHVTVSSFTVTRLNTDGSVVLEQKIESVKPAKTASGPLGKLLEDMEGASFTLTLSPDFKVLSLEGYDKLVDQIAKGDPNAQKVVQAMMSKETLQKSAEEAFQFLHRRTVRPKDSWERSFTMSLGPVGSVTGTYKYTYVGPEMLDGKPAQKIDVDAKLSYVPPKGDVGLLPFQITRGDMRVETGRGTIWFDEQKGRLVRSEMHVRLHGTLTMISMGQEYTLELDQDQSIKIRITDQDPTKQ
jgi:hypothetical protein